MGISWAPFSGERIYVPLRIFIIVFVLFLMSLSVFIILLSFNYKLAIKDYNKSKSPKIWWLSHC